MNHSSSFRLRINSDYLAAAAVTLAPLCYFFRAVLGQRVISPDDGIIFNIPLRVAAANIIRAGYVPLWNPYIFSGMPLHGAAQAGLLFPLNWPYLLFSAPVATNVMMLATYMLAALGAYLYARRSGSLVVGAIVTSLAWQWSSFLIAHIGHTNILQTAAMLPWILWAMDGYGLTSISDKQRRRGVLLAVLVAVQCFTGHQQTFAYSLIVAAAYAIVMARRSPERKTAYLRSLVFVAAGILLAAVQIVPTFELLRNSPRGSTSYEYFTSFSLPPRFVLTLLAPYLMGGGDGLIFRAPYIGPTFYAEYVAYVGLITLMLALVAVLIRPDKITKFWTIVVVVGLLLALGHYAPLGLYKLIYFVPVLSLFRVPARHLMEVDFALAVLAGRGVSTLVRTRSDLQALGRVKIAAIAVIALTLLTVTLARPANFKLGRDAPISFLRAPELFLPVVFSLFGVWAIWRFARGRRGATLLLLSVLVVDLAVWGQSSGWRGASAQRDFELWGEPDTVRFLRQRAAAEGGASYRILTEDQPFDPDVPVAPRAGGEAWIATLQPDIYMMYGIENAAGYDGFGLARYQRFAGDMKTWGELGDTERTLRGSGREIDLLNVRYLLTRPAALATDSSAAPSRTPAKLPEAGPLTFPDATESFGDQRFAAAELKLPSLTSGARLSFTVPPVEADTIALITNLSWSLELPDSTPVAHLVLHTDDNRKYEFDLRVGEHTSEWAYDRSDIRRQIRNQRAPVATSYPVKDQRATFNGHTYVCSFKLPEKATITSGELTVARVDTAPDLSLSLFRISLANESRSFPLRAEWITRATDDSAELQAAGTAAGGRWRRLKQLERVSIFENAHALPRAWLASEFLTLTESQILTVVRTGELPDGNVWNPRQLALVETQLAFPGRLPDATGRADLTKHEPNRLEIHTASSGPEILVVSENYFPGWRVYVDGQPAQLLRVNYNLRGVLLPQGEHAVSLVYRPFSVLIGAVLSLLTLIVLLFPLSLTQKILRRRNSARPA
ncbi:MAG TPA: YfhO family protein [Pyrinomonadaceae bacterium]|nr:YfhO family protein [Pyrinomonadaceae bacterium]